MWQCEMVREGLFCVVVIARCMMQRIRFRVWPLYLFPNGSRLLLL